MNRLREHSFGAGQGESMKLPPQDILLVEGHDDSREMVRWYLTRIGYQVRAASTCAASLSLVSVRRFNLYLLGDDCLDGTALDLCQQIRALDADTPILFCSAWAFPADRERGMRAGAQAYLTKPLEWDELEHTIVQLIGEVRAVAVELRWPWERANEGALDTVSAHQGLIVLRNQCDGL
jgi:DNA-binding response OmpR family regulator